MSNDAPNKSQNNAIVPQPEKSASVVAKLAKMFGVQVKDVQGNAKWDTIKFIYHHRKAIYPVLILAWSTMSAFITALIQKIFGIPMDWLIISILGVVSLIPLLILILIGRWLIKGIPFRSPAVVLQDESTGKTDALAEQSQSMNELIRAAARDLEKVPCGADWLHAIAENDRTQIQNAVQVRGIGLRNLMDEGIPKLEFVFSIYNKSVYQISIEFIEGYIRFNHEEKLRKNNLEVKETQPIVCLPRRSAFFTLEQTLLDSEVRYITSQTDDRLFWFDGLVVMIKGDSYSPDVVPQRLKIEGHLSLKEPIWRNYND